MSRLSCSFCRHTNPEGSKFCNECGSPLNLAPCSHCEAINNLSDSHCCRCGARLDPAGTAELAEAAHSAEGRQAHDAADTAVEPQGRAAATSSIPISLADRLASSTWTTPARPHDPPAPVEPYVPPSSADVAQDAPVSEDALPPYRGTVGHYGERRGYRMHGVVLTVLLVAVAGAIWWSSRDAAQTQPSVVAGQLTPPAQASSASAAPQATADPLVKPPEPAAPNPVPAASEPTVAPPVSTPPESARTPARAATEAPRHEASHTRTREEAERDAIATQRLIARDLGTPGPAEPSAGSPPAP